MGEWLTLLHTPLPTLLLTPLPTLLLTPLLTPLPTPLPTLLLLLVLILWPRTPLTPTTMPWLMTTLAPTSRLLSPLIALETSKAPTLLLSLTEGPRLSTTTPTMLMAMLLMLPMTVFPSTL